MPRKSSRASYLNRNHITTEQRLRYKFSVSKSDAARRNIAFTLTADNIIQMWRQQNGICPYTNKRMTLSVGKGLFWRNWSMSIDRLDPSGDYSPDNVVLCRYDANRKKHRKNFFSLDFMKTYPDVVCNVLRLKPHLQELAA